MPKSGRGCQTRNNISHQILAAAPNQSRGRATTAIGVFEAFVTFARLHGVTVSRCVRGSNVTLPPSHLQTRSNDDQVWS
jgi:hypothetical protein